MSSPDRSTAAMRRRTAGALTLDLAATGLGEGLRLLSWPAMQRLAGRLGGIVALRPGRKRGRISENLTRASLADGPAVHREVWSHIAKTYLEILWLSSRGPAAAARHLTVEGQRELAEAAGQGRGVLLVSGHLGNWELVSLRAAHEGLPVAVVARRLRTRWLERRLIALRRRHGVRTLLRGEPGSSVAAYRWLARGGVLGCMMDRVSAGRRLLIPFLGKATHVPLGPPTLACRTGAAVMLGTGRRLDDGRIAVRYRRLPTDDVSRPEEMARIVGAAIEQEIRAVPRQWLWLYRRQPEWNGVATHIGRLSSPGEHGAGRPLISA